MTTLDISGGTEVIDPDGTVVVFFAVDRFIKERTERVVPSDADNERFIRRSKRRIRPVDEAAEIVEEGGFERIFTLRGRGGLEVRGEQRHQSGGHNGRRSVQTLQNRRESEHNRVQSEPLHRCGARAACTMGTTEMEDLSVARAIEISSSCWVRCRRPAGEIKRGLCRASIIHEAGIKLVSQILTG